MHGEIANLVKLLVRISSSQRITFIEYDAFEPGLCLVQFQLSRGMIQASPDRFIELIFTHLIDFLKIAGLQEEEGYKGNAHYYGDKPNRGLFHTGKDKCFENVR